MTTDRELRQQIETAEARLRESRQELISRRDTFPQRTAGLQEDRRRLEKRVAELKPAIAAAREELERVNAELGQAWETSHNEAVSDGYDGQRSLTVIDGLLNAFFGETPDWAKGQSVLDRFTIRLYQGMGKKP